MFSVNIAKLPVSFDFHSMEISTVEVPGYGNCMFVQQKKVNDNRFFIFGWTSIKLKQYLY